jgi:hypothetical protein
MNTVSLGIDGGEENVGFELALKGRRSRKATQNT